MYLLFTSFFVSLSVITLMIGRKLLLLRSGQVATVMVVDQPFVPDFYNLRHSAVNALKNLVKILVFVTLKIYVKFSNFLKTKYNALKSHLTKMSHSNEGKASFLGTEANRFLKTISEYKNKIDKMKHSIHEEEKNM